MALGSSSITSTDKPCGPRPASPRRCSPFASASRPTGFCSTSAAPSENPRRWSATTDTTTTGTASQGAVSFRRFSSSQPSMPGNRMSSVMMSGVNSPAMPSASSPDAASRTSKPSASSWARISAAASSLSSTTSARRRPARPAALGSAAGSSARAASRSGSQTVKQLPRPGSLVTATVPPCSCARRCTITSPSPVPSALRVTAFETCMNGANSARVCSGAMPMPVSVTEISTNRSCSLAGNGRRMPSRKPGSGPSTRARSTAATDTATSPPFGVNLIALDSRFSRICLSRLASAAIVRSPIPTVTFVPMRLAWV